ncbi:MAG: hypothetical protein A3G80_07605 [Betaproteobacteria bacterium RIFCSPLOWO2_12_FULL_62_13b]|nr:MAG: hypothetical protein A3G80_07605 [Betaproteobacteria bacterium RIFCSPLOWO2_12_FULL_62_13b]
MKKAIVLLGALAGLMTAGAVPAQSWPNHPVKLIVPFAAGGTVDVVTRIVANRLTAVLGQQFLVENRTGAGGSIAAEFVAKSAPDGYTFFAASTGQIQLVPLVIKVAYDGLKDFVPVVNIATNPFVLSIHPSIPAKTLREFVDYAKARQGKLNYGSSGTGAIGHLTSALLVARAGLTMTHVPYKGNAPAMADLVGGQVQMVFGPVAEMIAYMRADKVTVLGVSSGKRTRELPGVPSIAETYPGFHIEAWVGLLAPAGTPRDIVERLAREISRFVKEPAAIDSIRKIGMEPSGIALEEFTELISREKPMWVDAAKAAGIKQETGN